LQDLPSLDQFVVNEQMLLTEAMMPAVEQHDEETGDRESLVADEGAPEEVNARTAA
jgi:hypothetical protein